MKRNQELTFKGGLSMCARRLLPTSAQLRLASYFSCVFLFGAAWAAQRVWARADEGVLALGHELVGLTELTSRAESLELNGVRVQYASTITPKPLAATLDQFESHCLARPGVLAELSEGLAHPESKQDRTEIHRFWRKGIWREVTDTRGFVVCFAGTRAEFSTAIAALRHFAFSGDLSAFGRLRYFYAERVAAGTRAVTVWTEDSVNLQRMFPGDRDASGSDSRWVPRPPQALRLLSAAAQAQPLAVRIYDSAEQAPAVQSFYERWARQRGMRRFTRDADSSSYLSGNGAQLLVTTSRHAGRTTVTLAELGERESIPTAVEAEVSRAERVLK